jgi:nucleoside-diphosphate-sugar epimerase
MNVLVTGGSGYLGSRLVPKLLIRGHGVRVCDMGPVTISQLPSGARLEVIRRDITELLSDDVALKETLEGSDCVIHLAAISSDRAAEEDADSVQTINVDLTGALAKAARERNLRFLFSSTCAIYGHGSVSFEEEDAPRPLSAYAASKVEAERVIIDLARGSWKPVILRNGTLYGYSARMRFDLVVNLFSFHSTLYNEIRLFGRAEHWRPFLHVADCADAFVFCAEMDSLRHMVYNVAHESLRIVDLIDVFRSINPRLKALHVEAFAEDLRSYRVSTRRIHEAGFRTRIGIELGAEELVHALVSGLIPDPESAYRRIPKWTEGRGQVRRMPREPS